MKKIAVVSLFSILLIIGILTYIHFNLPVMEIKKDFYPGIRLFNFYCDNLREPYEVVCETGNKELDIQCFVVEPGEEFRGSVVINKALKKEIMIHVKNNNSLETFSLPNPGLEKIGGGKSEGLIYYLEWDSKKNTTEMKYLHIIMRKLQPETTVLSNKLTTPG